MATIEEVLARRSDLSTFLVHLTRTHDDTPAKDALISILQQGAIEARTAFGQAVQQLESWNLSTDSQRCIAMTETPIEHVSLLAQRIEGRRCQFEPYGVAITKKQGRRLGVNPVWYVDMTPGHDWLVHPLNALVEWAIKAAAANGTKFEDEAIAKVAPFFEQMGTWKDKDTGLTHSKEFWWEREWRHVGDFDLPDTFMVLCPEADHGEIQQHAGDLPLIDPRWSLEQIIGHLAGFDPGDIGPL